MSADGSPTMMVEPSFILGKLRALLPDSDHEEKLDAGCILWDLSADAQTAAFMREHGVLSLLLHPLANAQASEPRLVEICAGTCANLASVDKPTCTALLEREDAAQILVALLLQSTDAPTLSELLRLLSALLVEAAAQPTRGVLTRWLAAVAAPPCLEATTFFLRHTLRADLMARAATFCSTALYCEARLQVADDGSGDAETRRDATAAPSKKRRADAGPNGSSSSSSSSSSRRRRDDEAPPPPTAALPFLLSLDVLPSLTELCASQLARRGHAADAPDESCLLALLQLFDTMACHTAEDATTRHYCLDPTLLQAAPKLLRAAEPHLVLDGADGGGEADAGVHQAPELDPMQVAILDAVRAAWTVLHTAASRLDGLSLCMNQNAPAAGGDDTGGTHAMPGAFGALVGRARAISRACAWAHHSMNGHVGVSEMATSTVTHIHDAASVVVTAGGCADALGGGGSDADAFVVGAEDDADAAAAMAMVGGGGTATDVVLRALNLFRASLEGEEEEEEEEGRGGDGRAMFASDDEDEPAAGFGEGLPGVGGGGGAAWASLSDDEEQDT